MDSHPYSSNIRRRKYHGAALAAVLMVVMLAVIASFSLAGTSMFHLNVTNHEVNSLKARNLADSIVSQGIEKIIGDEQFGMQKDETLTITSGEGESSSSANLTFDTDEAARLKIPYSTNNLKNDAAVLGWGDRIVPRNSVHLTGTGQCNGITRRIEAVVYFPPFPYVIASTGKFESSGALIVAGVSSLMDYTPGMPENELLPGSIVSNNPDKDAISLLGEGTITGNVQSSGGVVLNPQGGMEILGEIKCNADPAAIQKIHLADYDPVNKKGLQTMPRYLDSPSLEGFCRREGDLVVAGNLQLKEALLYVNGNLEVGDGMTGRGAVIVTGTTKIGKGADLTSDNLVALLSGSDVSLGGAGSVDSSSFNGIVYTEGNFTAEQVTLLGSFISAGDKSTTISMNNVNLIQVPMTSVDIFTHTTFFMHDNGNFNGLADSKKLEQHAKEIKEMNGKSEAEIEQWASNGGNKLIVAIGNTGYKITQYVLKNGKLAAAESTYTDLQQMLNNIYSNMAESGHNVPDQADFMDKAEKAIAKALKMNDENIPAQSGDQSEWGSLDFGPSRFLSRADRMRLLLWKEY